MTSEPCFGGMLYQLGWTHRTNKGRIRRQCVRIANSKKPSLFPQDVHQLAYWPFAMQNRCARGNAHATLDDSSVDMSD